jgi:tetratricopeptide (TPR) repeat protein
LKISDRFSNAIQMDKNGEYEKALSEYIDIVKEDNNFRDGHLYLGSLYARMGKFSKAMKSYVIALSLGADYMVYFNIGSIFYKLGDFKKAVINLEKSKKIFSAYYLSSLMIGLSFSKLNNTSAAEINFTNVLSLKPENKVALTALSIIYYNQKNYSLSLELLNRLIFLDPDNIKILKLRSDVLLKQGKYKESAKELNILKKNSIGYKSYDDFVESVPDDSYSDKYGTIEEKIEFLEEKEDNHDNLISLSLCYLFKGETDAAIESLFKAKEIR